MDDLQIKLVYQERNAALAALEAAGEEIKELREALKTIADPYQCVTVDIAWYLAKKALAEETTELRPWKWLEEKA